jgi:hypothetical protein
MRAVFVIMSVSLLIAAPCCGADSAVSQEFRQAKAKLQMQLRSRQAADRVAALRQIGEFGDLDAAKLVMQLGLRDAAPEVRQAAFDALRSYRNQPEICRMLLGALKKGAKAKQPTPGADVLLAVLLSSDDEEIAEELSACLENPLGTSPGGPALVAMTADQLGLHGEEPDLAPLKKLTATKLFEANFAVRRAVVQAIMRIREPAAIDDLIQLLGRVEGEVRGDISQYLAEVTRQQHGLDAAAWGKWWAGAKADFKFPPLARAFAAPAAAGDNRSSYYGLPLFAERVVFVFDTSGSMGGARLEAAKRELAKAITTLPENCSFGIVVFNTRVASWQKQLVLATQANKDAAARFVGALVAREQTATYDALAAAFNFDAEAIYLLTDGEPTTGRVVNASDIVASISRGNLARRLSIYVIGIGVGPEGGPFDAFLSELAKRNFGQYRRVDQ